MTSRTVRRFAPAFLLCAAALTCSLAPVDGLYAAPTAKKVAAKSAPVPKAPPAPTLDFGVFDAVKVGEAVPEGWVADEQVSEGCLTYRNPEFPAVYVMTDGAVVERITLEDGATYKTLHGIGLGVPLGDVFKVYQGATSTPRPELGTLAQYINAMVSEEGSGMRFEIGELGTVTAIHAGLEPWLDYTNGCA